MDNQEKMDVPNHPRIFLWSAPRTLSTAFFRAMESREKVEVVLEPYSFAYFFGTERLSDFYDDDDRNMYHEMSMDESLKKLQTLKSEDCLVFAKDHAFYILCRENPSQYIPEGYENVFLFRDPKKSFISAFRMNKQLNPDTETLKKLYENGLYSMKNVWDLYQMIRIQHPNKTILVIDGDDFAQEPEKVLRAVCNQFHLEYEDSMLKWDQKSAPSVVNDSVWKIFFGDALSTNTVDKSIIDRNAEMMSQETIPDFVHKLIEEDLVYYEKLKAVKLKL